MDSIRLQVRGVGVGCLIMNAMRVSAHRREIAMVNKSLLHRLTFCESLKGSKLFVVFPYNTVLAFYDPGHKVCIVFTHVSTLVLPLIYILDVVHFF